MALRNGILSSPKAIATAERHREIIELRKQGVGELHSKKLMMLFDRASPRSRQSAGDRSSSINPRGSCFKGRA